MTKRDFYEIDEDGNTIYLLKSRHNKKYYYGEAKVHPEDKNFKSSLVGINIARDRAKLAELTDRINSIEIMNKYYKNQVKEMEMTLRDLKSFKEKLKINLNNYLKNIDSFNFRLKKLLNNRKGNNQ